jgi:hypothetical protein
MKKGLQFMESGFYRFGKTVLCGCLLSVAMIGFASAQNLTPDREDTLSRGGNTIEPMPPVPAGEVPEPATWVVLAVGAGLLSAGQWYRRKSGKVN